MERFTWERLPVPARAAFEAEFGRVRAATTTPAGLTVGIASRVETEHTTVFVKAIPRRSPALPDYERERAVARVLPAAVPAPRLRWVSDGGWLTLVFDHIDGHPPDLGRDSPAVMATLTGMRDPLTPSPLPDLRPISAKLGPMLYSARSAARGHPDRVADMPAYRAVLDGADLRDYGGESLLHADPAVTNMIHDGTRIWLVDWALASRGAAWVDAALLLPRLVEAGASPTEAERWAAKHPDWTSAPDRAVNLLAVIHLLFLLDKIQTGPDWLAQRRQRALRSHETWARHRLGLTPPSK